MSDKVDISRLTPREREILERLVAGKTNGAIAAELGTDEAEIRARCIQMMKKLQATSFAHLIRLALEAGMGLAGSGG
jgi:FixJ family two-component response regulator